MIVVLETTAGPIAGRRIEIPAGATLRIGRTAKSDYAIGEDSYLSSSHFSVECDGAQCRVRDLGSSNGTFVNGDRITDRVAQEGDSIAAGGSTFVVHLETSAPAPEAPTTTKKIPTIRYPGASPPLERTARVPGRDSA